MPRHLSGGAMVWIAVGFSFGALVTLAMTWREAAAHVICKAGGPNLTLPARYRQRITADRCTPFGRPERIFAVWTLSFEVSAAQTSDFTHVIWLDLDDTAHRQVEQLTKAPIETNGRWQLTFVGRRAINLGGYGHLNAYPYLIVVDEVIDAVPMR